MNLAHLVWDPDRIFFVVPYFNHPVTWYGLFFAIGFLIGYWVLRKVFIDYLIPESETVLAAKSEATSIADRIMVCAVLGTIVGARLGHVFFYSWPYFKQNPMDIFKIWEGGLASHGGAVGVFVGLLVFYFWNKARHRFLSFLLILDAVVIPTAFVGGCIRIGNFINQEILGIPTTLPWGVIFLHPMDGTAGIPVHPVQLYEALFYFGVFAFLVSLWRRNPKLLGLGRISGLFFILVFTFRFLVEFIKVRQSALLSADAFFSMGQMLSLPFIGVGIGLVIWSYVRTK